MTHAAAKLGGAGALLGAALLFRLLVRLGHRRAFAWVDQYAPALIVYAMIAACVYLQLSHLACLGLL